MAESVDALAEVERLRVQLARSQERNRLLHAEQQRLEVVIASQRLEIQELWCRLSDQEEQLEEDRE